MNDKNGIHVSLSEAIDKIEGAYEFMLAYAAQGRDREAIGEQKLSIRDFLSDLATGLESLDPALEEQISALGPDIQASGALADFRQRIAADAKKALEAVALVRSVPSISSQLIDNLNASAHLRCVLTDIFVVDEALKIISQDRHS